MERCRFAIYGSLDETYESRFDHALKGIDRTSTPGKCFLRCFGTTNGVCLGWNGIRYDPVRVSMLKFYVKRRIQNLLRGEPEADPINVFIKQEAHKKAKLDEGRYRLISGVSLVDTMIDRILFEPFVEKLEDTAHVLKPVLYGWTPLKGGYRALSRKFRGKKVLSLDRKAWDWTVQKWMTEYLLKFFEEMAYVDDDAQWWIDLARARFRLLFSEAEFSFPDTTQLRQGVPGIMKSGCFLTLIGNSLLQFLLHCVACVELGIPVGEFFSVGDDTVQELPAKLEQYRDLLLGLGVRLKEPCITEPGESFEFVGFVISELELKPAYREKHNFNLRHLEEEVAVDAIKSYQILYAHDKCMHKTLSDWLHRVYGEVPLRIHDCRRVLDINDD